MNKEFENIRNIITCIYCGEVFSKENKPLILKCSHFICQICHKINKESLPCLVCKIKYTGKENINHPVNFLLVELIEKEDFVNLIKKNNLTKNISEENLKNISKEKKENFLVENKTKFFCNNCNLNFRNEYHFLQKDSKCQKAQKIIEEKSIEIDTNNYTNNANETSKIEILASKSENLMEKYNKFNTEINSLYEDYICTVLKNFVESQNYVLENINKNNLLENLILLGILPENHLFKVLKFMKKYFLNKTLRKIIKSTTSCEDEKNPGGKIENLLSDLNLLETNSLEFKVNDFLSDFFFFKNVLQNLKKNFVEKFEILEDLFKINTYQKENEEKNLKLNKILELYNKDIIHKVISEISNNINFSNNKDISNLKFSYFFIKNKNKNFSNLNFPIEEYSDKIFIKNKLDLITFDPLTQNLKKTNLENLINKIKKLYDNNQITYSKDILKINFLKKFDFNHDQYGNIFIYGGYYKFFSKEIIISEFENYFLKKEQPNKIYIPNNFIFKVNPFKKKIKILYELINPKLKMVSVIVNKDLYILGGQQFKNKEITDIKKIERFGENFRVLNLKNLNLSVLKDYPNKLTNKPIILNHVYENIFVCENIKNFAFYNIKNKKWKESEILYTSENIRNISNFTGFNSDRNIIILGGNTEMQNKYVDLDEEDLWKVEKNKENILNMNIFSVEKKYYSVSKTGEYKSPMIEYYKNSEISQIKNVQYEIAYLMNETYIIEYHEKIGMFCVLKNFNLKEGIFFDTHKIIDFKDL